MALKHALLIYSSQLCQGYEYDLKDWNRSILHISLPRTSSALFIESFNRGTYRKPLDTSTNHLCNGSTGKLSFRPCAVYLPCKAHFYCPGDKSVYTIGTNHVASMGPCSEGPIPCWSHPLCCWVAGICVEGKQRGEELAQGS